jgi:hypothetical protein
MPHSAGTRGFVRPCSAYGKHDLEVVGLKFSPRRAAGRESTGPGRRGLPVVYSHLRPFLGCCRSPWRAGSYNSNLPAGGRQQTSGAMRFRLMTSAATRRVARHHLQAFPTVISEEIREMACVAPERRQSQCMVEPWRGARGVALESNHLVQPFVARATKGCTLQSVGAANPQVHSPMDRNSNQCFAAG